MHHFHYQNGELHAEDVPVARIAAAVGTPVYIYSSATLRRHYQVYRQAFDDHAMDHLICYAVKANGNLSVIATLARLGAGADVVSEGELRLALAAGVPTQKIVYSGVGKTREELAFALQSGILQINVESIPELQELAEVANRLQKPAEIAIRVNPDVDSRTHAKIATGGRENKFGIDIDLAPELYDRVAAMAGLTPVSVAVHIGSQLTDLAPYRAAFTRVAALVRQLRAAGHDIRRLDLGGGLGIPYKDAEEAEAPPLPDAYAAMVQETVGALGCRLLLEPGRLIVGNAGLLATRVLYPKEGASRRFLILDAGMNDLIRPALYDGYHGLLPVREPLPDAPRRPWDIVGPVCESGDLFARDRMMPDLAAGDLVVMTGAGAYGAVMASGYNGRRLVPEILVDGGEFATVRPRQTYREMLDRDCLAPWLTHGHAHADGVDGMGVEDVEGAA